jgi:hypothetical protein
VNKAVKISHAAFYYAMDEFEDVTNGSAYAAAATKRQDLAMNSDKIARVAPAHTKVPSG